MSREFADYGVSQAEQRMRSPLVERAITKLQTLPLVESSRLGLTRRQEDYFLNITYPSMQVMPTVTQEEIFPSEEKENKEREVALYVHIPFCTAQCYYCHYYKEFNRREDEVDSLLTAVDRQLQIQSEIFGGMNARSIYVGGGTPSYLTPQQIDRLFGSIRRYIEVPEGIEVSFEVHPESATQRKLEKLRENGVNRINIGVESFNEKELAQENRRHTAKDALEAFELARVLGFNNINLDLIYGLMGQSMLDWEHNLKTIGRIKPDSATMYYLRTKQTTSTYQLWRRYRQLFPSDNERLIMHAMTLEYMEGRLGYTQRPVDWFIRDESIFHEYQRHNWRDSDDTELLGVGPSAYSYINGYQHYMISDLRRYQNAISEGRLPIWKGERLEGREKLRRSIMLGLKMGINRERFKKTYGVDPVDAFQEEWRALEDIGAVIVDGNTIKLDYLGKLFADEVGQLFYSDQMRERMSRVEPSLISTTRVTVNN